MSRLLSPRPRAGTLADFGERTTWVARQQVGRPRVRQVRPVPRLPSGRRVLKRLFGAVVIAATPVALAVGSWWAVTSPLFAVPHVEVRGAQQISSERIAEATGITFGQSLFLIDPRKVVRGVEALPEVQRAELIRELPNRVTVVVEERKPFTLVHAGRLHWIDEGGRVLGRETQAVAPPAPIISGLTEAELRSIAAQPNGKARDAIRLIRMLLRSGSALGAEISEIDMSSATGPVLYTVGGVEVRLGAEEWDERLARLEGVLAQPGVRDGGIRSVDLRFRDQVVLQGGR